MKAIINTKAANTEGFDDLLKEILLNDLHVFKSGRGRFLRNNQSKQRHASLIA
ncbi:MAG: hypothetical protein H7Y07_18380 [Pyrinomonadaceae bacterium]|nr:hypothetical protein [Sphingobacteriaceae bacterium]